MGFIISLFIGMGLALPTGFALANQFGIWGLLLCLPVGFLIGAGSAEVFGEI